MIAPENSISQPGALRRLDGIDRRTTQGQEGKEMKKTNVVNLPTPNQDKMLVDINGLQALLSCGMVTAKKIAESADASIKIGKRRLYNVEKIKKYVANMGGF